MTVNDAVGVGVIGVGSMGAHHARVYSELPGAELRGVADADHNRADTIASRHETRVRDVDALLEVVDAVSIAVPTDAHARLARRTIAADTHLLVEKPFVRDHTTGRELIREAEARDLVLQIGHVERFNPAVQALFDLVSADDVIALRADRLGPPIDRSGSDGVVMDLMIHDIDILMSLMGGRPDAIQGARGDDGYASVVMEFDEDVVATVTASRVTQRKTRRLEVTTAERHLVVDYIDQSVRVHRRSRPAYLQDDAEMRYRHESIIEQPLVESAEPLRLELEAYLTAVRNREDPPVAAEDGLAALAIADRINRHIAERPAEVARR